MNELTRTGVYLGAAVALLIGVVATQPRPQVRDVTLEQGKPFFKKFDPSDAKGMEIVEFDEKTSTLKPFKVAQVGGVWSIPSHSNYPSDADRQLADAAASIIDLKKDAHVESTPAMHELFGVITPDAQKLSVGATGVGKRVRMWDANEKTLADIIIGKEVEGKPGRRYVRDPNNDVVYEVAIDTKGLSTRFGDWIEPDLMKINTSDITNVGMREYSIDEQAGAIIPKSKIQLDYDSSAMPNKWALNSLEVFNGKTVAWEPASLTEDQELDTKRLDDMVRALDELKIIEVNRKPAGVRGDLKLDAAAVKNREIVTSLRQRGFFPNPVSDTEFELLSNEGEVLIDLKDGVEYVLRFGEIATGVSETPEEGAAKDETKPEEDKGEGAGSSRYIMITAQFREDLIPKPELTELPPGPDGEPAAADAASPDAAAKPDAVTEAKDAAPAGEEAPKPSDDEAPKPDAAPAEDNKQSRSLRNLSGELLAFADDAAPPAAATDAQPAVPEAAAEPEEKPEANAAETEAAPPAKEPAAPKAAAPAAATIKTANDLAAERARIQVENKRKQQDYEDRVRAGKKRVEELNRRFGDWYYIISNSEYKKIHLGRDDIVKTKERKPGEGNTLEDFETLKKEGLEGNADGAETAPPTR